MSEKKQMSVVQALELKSREIGVVIPAGMDLNRVIKIVSSEVNNNEDLKACSPASVLRSVLNSLTLGLEPGATLGHGYLVPYKGECKFIPGYQGLIELATRSEKIMSVYGHPIYENDRFEFQYGSHNYINHSYDLGVDRGVIVGSYAVAEYKNGHKQFYICSLKEINEARACAPTTKVWDKHYDAMAAKTAVRRLSKFLPKTPELARAIELDEVAERGEKQTSDIDLSFLEEEKPAKTREQQAIEQLENNIASKRRGI